MIIKHNQAIEHQGQVHRLQTVNRNEGRNENAKWKHDGTWYKVYHLATNNWSTSPDLAHIQKTAEQVATMLGVKV